MPFWIKFEDGSKGCAIPKFIEGETWPARVERTKLGVEEAIGKKVADIQDIPYAAYPIIWGELEPTFCHSPDKCAAKGRCAGEYSCID